MTFYSVEDHGDLWEADANWDAEDLHNPGDNTTIAVSDRATAPGTPALVGKARARTIELDVDLSPRWRRLWKMIQLHEEFWLDFFKTLTSSNDRKLAKEFLRKTWNPIYERFLILQPEYRGKDLPRDLRELSEGLSRARMVASTLKMPIPDIGSSGPFHGVSLSQSPISGETMSQHVPASFRALCQAYVTDDGVLVASVELRNGKRYEASIALAPLAERIKGMIRRYHSEVLHGDMREETIAGLGDWFQTASDAAVRVAHSKAVKQIYQSHLKYRKEILAATAMIPPPYGIAISTGLAVGYKVHDKIVAAKKGDPQAIAALTALNAQAKSGDPKAQDAWNSALAIKAAMDAKEDKQALPPLPPLPVRNPWGMEYGYATPGASGPIDNENVSGWGDWNSSNSGWGYGHGDDSPGATGDDTNEYISGRRKRRKLSKAERRRLARARLQGRAEGRKELGEGSDDQSDGEAPKKPSQASQASPSDQGGDDDIEERLLKMEEALARGEDVSGFLYNRPYRVSVRPGKLNLRNLYNLGLAR